MNARQYLKEFFGCDDPADASAGTIATLEENIVEDPVGHTLDQEAYLLILDACPDVREDPSTKEFLARGLVRTSNCRVCTDLNPHCTRCGGRHPDSPICFGESEHRAKWEQRWGHISDEGPKPRLVVEVNGGICTRVFHYYAPHKGLSALAEDLDHVVLDWDDHASDPLKTSDEGHAIAKELYPEEFPDG